jgi:hypothetical protein
MLASRMRPGLFLLNGFFALAGVSNACSPKSAFVHPLQVPEAVFEARLVDRRAGPSPDATALIPSDADSGSVEVIRAFHGPYRAGDRLPILISHTTTTCDRVIDFDASFLMIIPRGTHAPFSPNGGDDRTANIFRLLVDEGRAMPDREARAMFERARVTDATDCTATRAGYYVQVSCGRNPEARSKVIFERVDGHWLEVLRYATPLDPATTPAR